MILVKVPAINGLGKTKGCEKAPDLLCKKHKECKEIKVDNENIEEMQESIYNRAKGFFKGDKNVFFLGGDHSISYPIIKAFSESSKRKKCLVVFDAHADCMKPMKEPTHEEWLRAAIEEKLIDKIFLIGLRKIEPEEKKFLDRIKEARIVSKNEKINLPTDHDLYLSIDIDVFNPEIAPGTGYKEKGGLNEKEFFCLLRELKSFKNLK
ncbi:MAG TPA: hypothetical protein EYP89_01670, partial [Candidatus Omnitrophica bacterium]|nr:hypothetical protein [Candidatus Omnitrophota bacterium]